MVQPNIIVFVMDDMRADDWRVLSKARRLIGGTEFPHFVYDSPLCAPTRATLLTGQQARHHGIRVNNPGWPDFRRREAQTIGPALQAAGYHTGWCGKYFNGYDRSAVPPGWNDWRAYVSGQGYRMPDGQYVTNDTRDKAIEIVQAAPPDKPLLLVVSNVAPHDPHEPLPKYAAADVEPALNDDDRERKRCMLSVDDQIAHIARAMGPRWDAAAILVVSDHGYLLGEHDTIKKAIWWDQAARVPLLARVPGIAPGVDDRLACSIDVAPTILRAAGAAATWPVDGMPLQDAWDREGMLVEGRSTSLGTTPRTPFDAIKGKDWLYVEPQGQAPMFFRDPDELINTIEQEDAGFYARWLDELTA